MNEKIHTNHKNHDNESPNFVIRYNIIASASRLLAVLSVLALNCKTPKRAWDGFSVDCCLILLIYSVVLFHCQQHNEKSILVQGQTRYQFSQQLMDNKHDCRAPAFISEELFYSIPCVATLIETCNMFLMNM